MFYLFFIIYPTTQKHGLIYVLFESIDELENENNESNFTSYMNLSLLKLRERCTKFILIMIQTGVSPMESN